jgi:hypothetical protein
MSQTTKALILLAALCAYAVAYGQTAPPIYATPPTTYTLVYKDLATMVGPIDKPFKFCWDETTGDSSLELEFQRWRPESGFCQKTLPLPRSAWLPGETPTQFCAADKLSASGHWIYEARFCTTAGGVRECGDWAASSNPETGRIDGQSRGWWVYGFLPKPGGGVITGLNPEQERFASGKGSQALFQIQLPRD